MFPRVLFVTILCLFSYFYFNLFLLTDAKSASKKNCYSDWEYIKNEPDNILIQVFCDSGETATCISANGEYFDCNGPGGHWHIKGFDNLHKIFNKACGCD